MDERSTWQEGFRRMNINDLPINLSPESSQHNLNFQHRLDRPNEKDADYTNFKPPVTLQYRDSISSNASSTLSRNSTVSSSDTRYFSSLGSIDSPPIPLSLTNTKQPTPLTIPAPKNQIEIPNTISPTRQNFQYTTFSDQVVEPTGCFVPSKPLPFIQKTEVTKHHYVIPTFAMAGESQAEVMKLIFNQADSPPFQAKEEYERTIPWHIDGNSSLVTLSQYTCLGKENPISRNYLLGLGQRLGITTILVIVSIEAIGTVYPLIDNLIKSMEVDTSESNMLQKNEPTWWSRVVLVVNQQHNVSEQATYSQRKTILVEEMPRIQERYRLSQPLSVLFLSTQVFNSIKNTPQGTHYKSCSQRILWQMMEKHTLSGRWCSELITLQNRARNNEGSLANVLNEDDETTSSSDDAIFKTVIDYVDGKKKRPTKKKSPTSDSSANVLRLSPFNNNTNNNTPSLQRRSTRRQPVQKLHCHDGDDGMGVPLPIRRF